MGLGCVKPMLALAYLRSCGSPGEPPIRSRRLIAPQLEGCRGLPFVELLGNTVPSRFCFVVLFKLSDHLTQALLRRSSSNWGLARWTWVRPRAR